ncbi:glycosyltransferase family 9 protein, partial [bacterium]|nr:glycosyltransferase family 9 protein [candidate division CSSED10-310 bacterium]
EAILEAVRERANRAEVQCVVGLDLVEMAAVIARARLLVTNDSAPMHMGVATGTPTVAVFGPTNPKALLPGEAAHVRAVTAGLDCSPCYSNSQFPGCAEPRCIASIDTADVLRSCIELLERNVG